MRLTILCENSVACPFGLLGEHGFACFLETASGNYLFDTGQGQTLLPNARRLGKDLAGIEALLISHGHYDHTGGLQALLSECDGLDIYGHPEMFSLRYWEIDGRRHDLGVPFERAALEAHGARFHLSRELIEVGPEVFLSGEIPRRNAFEQGDPQQVAISANGEELRPDPVADDLSMVIRSLQGLVLVVGCAHAGLVNILDHVAEQFPGQAIHAVVGGTHLGFAGEEQFDKTLEALDHYGIKKIGVSHCTGMKRSAQLAERLGERFFFANVGTVLEV